MFKFKQREYEGKIFTLGTNATSSVYESNYFFMKIDVAGLHYNVESLHDSLCVADGHWSDAAP